MRAVVDAAHAHGRAVVTQSWALDGGEVAELGIDEVHNTSRTFISKEYPARGSRTIQPSRSDLL